MTALDELKAMTDNTVSAEVAAKAIGIGAQSIRVAVRDNPYALNFPTIVAGKNIRVPRLPLINLIESGSEWFEARNKALKEQ